MNTSNIKKYAPKARTAFMDAIRKQAAIYGISRDQIAPATQKGDVVLIGERVFGVSVLRSRERLLQRVTQEGFDAVIEHVAYSWFNRLCAIRYMELKGFLDHGRRVLSSADGSAGMPQILEECLDIELEGLDQNKVRALKLDGTQDEALYRELLLAQCHALHQAMPFLFEAVADESELLLPDNLTKTDSLIRDLVASVPEQDWDNIEIIGWLYQFYISDKKDQVIGKVVKSEDIPAATQLFTPNWIVQYLVQNSVGRQWMQTYPDSTLVQQMPYYIAPAEQSAEVQAQLAAITPNEITPESIKVLDPAVGSGHILVEAYKVLKAIYAERGYRTRDIPQLILQHNLFGLDIDDRAGQLAGFALMMLAREDDRKIFERDIRLNVLALQSSAGLDVATLWRDLNLNNEVRHSHDDLFDTTPNIDFSDSWDECYCAIDTAVSKFSNAKNFGSLIEIEPDDYMSYVRLLRKLEVIKKNGTPIPKAAAQKIYPIIAQAVFLSRQYDVVVANPPYMGSKGMNAELKAFAQKKFPDSKSDLFAMFMERGFSLLKSTGLNAQVNMQSWMFLSSYESLRQKILDKHTFITMAHLGARAFSQISGEVVQTTAFVMLKKGFNYYPASFYKEAEEKLEQLTPERREVVEQIIKNKDVREYKPTFFRLIDGNEEEKQRALLNREQQFSHTKQDDFKKIPASPIAYWVSERIKNLFVNNKKIGDMASPRKGCTTTDNATFLRFWPEISLSKAVLNANDSSPFCGDVKWAPYNKGGGYRKWYGYNEFLVDWESNGAKIKAIPHSVIANEKFFFHEGLTWSTVTSSHFSIRGFGKGFIFDNGGCCVFSDEKTLQNLIGLMNSKVFTALYSQINPTLNFQSGDVAKVPVIKIIEPQSSSVIQSVVSLSESDWDAYERSWDFARLPILSTPHKQPSLAASYTTTRAHWQHMTSEMQRLEQENNRIFIDAYGLQDELTPDVPLKEITLTCNPHYRYGGDKTHIELEQRLQSDTAAELISYAIGCMMGRYSLDRDGLVYAHAGNQGFNDLVQAGAYNSFPADDDGIIPLTAQEWFDDDTTTRFANFIQTIWPESPLSDNLNFVAESLCLNAIKPLSKKGMAESAHDTIRRYLSSQFYKDHLKTYKKRPIYWLFSSGKEKTFECLVYLHRYNDGTLSRMRTEYVIPLTAKLSAYAHKLEQDKENSQSTTEIKRLEKEISDLHKQQAELSHFDEKLRHYADQRISLDLDDGVKVNYGKFGDLLADVKAITGDKAGD